MATSSQSRRCSGPVLRSLSPRGRFPSSSSSSSSSSAFASSTSSSFYSPPTAFFNNSNHRSASPTRVNLFATSSPPSPTSFRFYIGRSSSPNRSIAVTNQYQNGNSGNKKMTCMCSPTTHPGSFRCSLHKKSQSHGHSLDSSYTPNRLNMRRSAMKNSLVRIGGVEGDLVRRALTALIRPSSHHQRRRCDFQPRPSRLSMMSEA